MDKDGEYPKFWGQRCKLCGGRDCFNFNVSNEIWERVVPRSLRTKVVCLPCFDALASRKGINYADALDAEFYFVGEMASLTMKIIHRAEPSSDG